MTKLKGFHKNRHERPEPIIYAVEFESGLVERVMAKSGYEARHKTEHLCVDYGFILHITGDIIKKT
jgi:hypothetical protein